MDKSYYKFLMYKYRFFFIYVIFGIISLCLEILVYSFLKQLISISVLPELIALSVGVIIAYWLNIRYNFKISKPKRNRALIYFAFISLTSYFIQTLLLNSFFNFKSYEVARILISGIFFWIAYFFHRIFSFKDYKKVGVAIYSNGVEDVPKIYKKVGQYPDFIHVDIVDKTFNKNSTKVVTYKTEVIRAYWNNKLIEAHIMSKYPKKWIEEIAENVDRIYIHIDISEKLEYLINLIRKLNCQVGLVVENKEQINTVLKFIDEIDSILVLSIKNPGYSGQKFNFDSLDTIKTLNKIKKRQKLSLNIDGGINDHTIKLLDSEYVVSGNFVLTSNDPQKNIMVLQTSSQYESV